MRERILKKGDWNNVMVLIHRGIEQCLDELRNTEFDHTIPELIENEDDRNYAMDRIADIQSGRRAIRWIQKKVVNG